MSKRERVKCPNTACTGGFVSVFALIPPTREQRHAADLGAVNAQVIERRTLCPVCHGLTKVKRKR